MNQLTRRRLGIGRLETIMTPNNHLIDNSSQVLSMLHTLKECLAKESFTNVYIATGYWDIPGLASLADDLKTFLSREGTSLKLLIGKDPYVYASQVQQPKYKDAKYPTDFIRTDINELQLLPEYEKAISLLLDYCTEEDDSKIQIRIYRTNEQDEVQFLHSKCYIFDGLSKGEGYGIIGSSNFTDKGLTGNAELNYLETDVTRVLNETNIPYHKTHEQWFFEKWECSEPWNKEFLEQVLKTAPITKKVEKEKEDQEAMNQPFTPYELYIKLLQLKFGDVIDRSLGQQIEAYLPSDISRLSYQIEAVKRCIAIMHEHGGFMLADVVGLGKTIVGTLIIKRFLSVPMDDGRERKVLIITPPAILTGWKKTIAQFDKDCEEKIEPLIDFITTGRIDSLTDGDNGTDDDISDTGEFDEDLQQKNYGLIIIDESHKFRNSDTQMYQAIDDLIAKIWSETGQYPYVGLLSATPQNNRPDDLKNQIYLFERDHINSTLKKAESGNLERFFSQVSAEYRLLIANDSPFSKEERKQRLHALSQRIRDCVLTDILERRTRTDVEKYYHDDMEAQHLRFPHISGPHPLEYVMDDELARLFADTQTIIAPTNTERQAGVPHLHYLRYRAIEYFNDPKNTDKHAGRGNRNATDVANQLATLMQKMLVKRLESSFAAFQTSLVNLRRYTENMIRMWENDTIFVCPQIDVNEELNTEKKSKKRDRKVTFDECIADIRSRIKKLTEAGRNERGQNAEYTRKDFREEYIRLLREDLELISSLCDRWAKNPQDPKFDLFKELLNPVLFNPQTNTAGKLVIFSEAIDTVDSLARAVTAKGHRPLVIKADNREKKEEEIAANFDANYDGELRNDYDVIITTEVLAEGVNLHRANVILNYDAPWNATRLMQRIGRVNRIGSKEEFVYVYNFLPSAQGDEQIKLVRKAYTKLQSFHVLFGEDSKVFIEEEDVYNYGQNATLEEEESPLEKYVFELKQYRDAHPQRYSQIEQTTDGWEIASAQTGQAVFLLKAPRSAQLAFAVTQDEGFQTSMLSQIDLLETIRTEPETPRMELPDNWQKLCEEAVKAYNQYFVRINRTRAGDKRTQALEVIHNLYNQDHISEKSKQLLVKVRRMVDRGNIDIIRKILKIRSYIIGKQMQLFQITQEEIDVILYTEMGNIAAEVELRQGAPQILIGTMK